MTEQPQQKLFYGFSRLFLQFSQAITCLIPQQRISNASFQRFLRILLTRVERLEKYNHEECSSTWEKSKIWQFRVHLSMEHEEPLQSFVAKKTAEQVPPNWLDASAQLLPFTAVCFCSEGRNLHFKISSYVAVVTMLPFGEQ